MCLHPNSSSRQGIKSDVLQCTTSSPRSMGRIQPQGRVGTGITSHHIEVERKQEKDKKENASGILSLLRAHHISKHQQLKALHTSALPTAGTPNGPWVAIMQEPS